MSKKIRITEEKAKKIAVGATVGGVLLICFLIIVLIIQFVQIGVKTAERNKLAETQTELQEMIASDERDLEFYKTQEGYYYLARKAGWQ